jgi:membrane protein
MSGVASGSDDRPPKRGRPGRRTYEAALAKGTAVADRATEWVEAQHPSTRKGASVGMVRRYQAADGQLYAVLLTAYIFITVLPAAFVMASYTERDPNALADRLVHRLGLTGATATFVREVLTGAGQNKLGSTLIAVASVVFFGLGIGRVLQLAHSRSWAIDLGKRRLMDQWRYLGVLLAPLGFLLVYDIQTRLLRGHPAWIGWLLVPLWAAVVLGYFVWMPRTLLHNRVTVRDVLPGAVFTLVGLIVLRVISSLLLVNWLAWYSTYYGGLGIVMAAFFWIMLVATVLVVAAALSPALAERRDLQEARAGR